MSLPENIGQLLAGVAIFLLGMSFLEETLRSLSGRAFKLFLRKQTSHKLKAMGAGAVVTGVLQSSSVVNMLVLSLVGAGVFQLQNALAVMLGSNLGTTFDSWIVASLGFKFNINSIAYFIGGISGISLAFFSSNSRFYQWCRFLLGFSFLFIGLGFIRAGMEDVVSKVDMKSFNELPLIAFFGIGVLLTSIIQSSSTTIALTLSALYSNAINLPAGMAIVLGSEIGTTLKLFLASAKGAVAKKQLALGNFLFNTVTCLLVLIFIRAFHELTLRVIGGNEKLIALVFFQSLVNLTGIILFFPFLKTFAGFLSRRYQAKEADRFINNISPAETQLAAEALKKESTVFLCHVLALGYDVFRNEMTTVQSGLNSEFIVLNTTEKYYYIKKYHAEIHAFYSRLQSASSLDSNPENAEQIASAVRNGMYAAKNLKDAIPDIDQLRNSSNDIKYNYYLKAKEKFISFSDTALNIINRREPGDSLKNIMNLYQSIQHSYTTELNDLYSNKDITGLTETEISTLLNFNREIFTYYKSVLFALKDAVLDNQQADKFDELPGFIR